jgi:uncharacterized protein
MSENFNFITGKDDLIRVTVYGKDNLFSKPCIILVHGFKGFKDWGFGPYIGECFAKSGFFVITFNFSHNGVGESLTEFDELDKFAENTFSLEIEELSQIIDAYSNNFFGDTENQKIGLLGHSRGGAISLLTAFNNEKINAAAVWASVSYFERYTERQKKEWREKGYLEVLNTRTNQKMRMNVSLLDDIEMNKNGRLNIEIAVRNFNKTLFIAHGEQDVSVPVNEAEKIYEWSDKSMTELYKIAAANHTFGVQHPFAGSNPKFEKLLEKTNNFFKTNLI